MYLQRLVALRADALAALLCAAIALELLSPQILRGFIDRARAGAGARVLIGTAALFMLVALGGGGVTVVETYVAESLGWTATNRLRADLALHLLRGRTAIIIAHRLTTVERADRVVTLDAGRVVEDGPRVELARDPASYYSRVLHAGLQEALQ